MVGMDVWVNALAAAGQGGRRKGKMVHKTANQMSWDHLYKKLLKTSVGSGTAGQDDTVCLTHPEEKTNSSDIAYERQQLRIEGAVKPRKRYLAFQFVQDTKVSSV